MAGYTITSGDHDLVVLAIPQQGRRSVRIRRFADRAGGTINFPESLSAVPVDAQQVGRIVGPHPVKYLNVQRVSEKQRRRGVAPVQAELSVVFLNVARP